MSKHLVLSIRPYDFENKKGERIQGAKVAYINNKISVRDNEFGFPPMLVSVSSKDLVEKFTSVPAIYDLEFEQVTGKFNKPEIILSEAYMCNQVNIEQFFQ